MLGIQPALINPVTLAGIADIDPLLEGS